MAVRKVKRRPLHKVGVGDMRDRIGIYTRALTAPDFDEYQADEGYTLLFERWSKVETISSQGGGGRVIFDDIDIKEQPNLIFTIRYESDVTSEARIKWRDEWYEIKKVIVPEGRNEYQLLYSKILGSTSKEANK